MRAYADDRKIAVNLRKNGKTYGEIIKKVVVSKSTLSLWLRNVVVPKRYFARIQKKKLDAVRLGWAARRKERVDRTERITSDARKEVHVLMIEPLWLVGVTLYWAEGHKEKSWRTGELVTFTNMDVNTIILFKAWSKKFLDISDDRFVYSLYIHDTRKAKSDEMRMWWANKISTRPENIVVYYKRSAKEHVRHNDDDQYRGVMRVRLKRSVDINRRIAGWTSALVSSLTKGNELA